MKIQIRGLDKWGTVNRKRKIYMSFWGHRRRSRNHQDLLSKVSTGREEDYSVGKDFNPEFSNGTLLELRRSHTLK